MKISFATPAAVTTGALVVGVLADRTLSPSAQAVDEESGGLLRRVLDASPRFKGGKDEVTSIPAPGGLAVQRLVLLGLGPAEALDAGVLARAGGTLVAHLNQVGETAATVCLDPLDGVALTPAAMAVEFAAGARLRAYRFDRYRTKQKPEQKPTFEALTLMADGAEEAGQAFAPVDKVVDGVYLTRDLVSEPANELYPDAFAERCKALSADGLEVEILDAARLKDLGMNALLGVGNGSVHESRVVILKWSGDPAGPEAPPLAFVGKGVTFDTGGISLKPASGMEDMKWDMGGAGVVTGLMKALAGRKARVNAVGLLGLVENMPSGSAQRPGDVVTSLSGQTIEVINTDAEGRLVLADVLWYAQERFQPKAMIDLATLTGAIIVALGQEVGGLFASDDALAEQLLAAAKGVGDKLWRLPLDEGYDKDIESQIADMKNVASNRWAGAGIAAQ
ncbi:MAG: leucyl aminopeptidase, partial [Verrucomicrobia bacterium]|nr:leucyl aminopeptidase [Verrucomicrobiota bacterium]